MDGSCRTLTRDRFGVADGGQGWARAVCDLWLVDLPALKPAHPHSGRHQMTIACEGTVIGDPLPLPPPRLPGSVSSGRSGSSGPTTVPFGLASRRLHPVGERDRQTASRSPDQPVLVPICLRRGLLTGPSQDPKLLLGYRHTGPVRLRPWEPRPRRLDIRVSSARGHKVDASRAWGGEHL